MKTKPSKNNSIVKMKVDKESTSKKADKAPAKKKVRKVKKEAVSVKVEQTVNGKIVTSEKTPVIKKVEKIKVKSSKKKTTPKKVKSKKKSGKVKPKQVVVEVPKPIKKDTKLKRWMKERNIIQKDLANQTRISTNTINRLIKYGKASNSVIESVSMKLGLSFEQLQELLKFEEQITV